MTSKDDFCALKEGDLVEITARYWVNHKGQTATITRKDHDASNYPYCFAKLPDGTEIDVYREDVIILSRIRTFWMDTWLKE